MKEAFHKVAARVAYLTGTPTVFMAALGAVLLWAVTGPLFSFSNTWQLMINTGTTIGTFLMVFLIQNTQNRDGKAMQLKLDELIRVSKTARVSFVDLEDMSDDELERLDQEFHVLHERNATSQALHKLHRKISAEHQRRRGGKL